MAPWEAFFRSAMKTISSSKEIIDIGGGLRITKERGNVYDDTRAYLHEWLKNSTYKILDPVPTYKPDIVGDIHALPFSNDSIDAYICLAVLEHVHNPWLGVTEMHRTLKKGGYCFAYVPFLFSYHAEPGYYNDFYRFTHEGTAQLFKQFSKVEIVHVRGACETIAHLVPGIGARLLKYPARALDILTGKLKTNQTSGFYVLAQK
jgi:SAM-dependent methyltransferase